ncbi:MAG: ABC transporter substrate-binding protein [Chloroflexi bacterium]|nr:ABC transporter substrate-binding protein [Chloroflexota bacterium]
MKKHNRQAIAASWMLVALLVAACMPARLAEVQAPSQPTDVAQLTKLNVCYTAHNPTQSVSWYARKQGIFAKYGLDVNLVLLTGGGPPLVAALLAGEVDFCHTGGGPIINAAVAGADVVLVAGLFNMPLYSLMVTPEIKQPEDLKGKIVASGKLGSSSDLAIRQALVYLHLTPDQDVTILQAGEQGDRLTLMDSGQVVGTLVSIPETIKAQARGYKPLLDLSKVDLPQVTSTIATTRANLKAHPATALAFMQAIVTAIAQMKQDEAGSKAAIAEFLEMDPTTDAALIAESYKVLIQQDLAEIPYPTELGIQTNLDALAQENPTVSDFKPADVIDISILRQLDESGFIRKLYQ